ncbi:disease resistance protein RPV1 [Eucalyptus grandis]|uniref:disease resistance protein RPV1 n=1 Tax=Eucalyptus grandis TaxID=71139 RepID=UPI00192EB1E4|nr:disease resistance protein RPV1 [Eucalyptus grandis]
MSLDSGVTKGQANDGTVEWERAKLERREAMACSCEDMARFWGFQWWEHGVGFLGDHIYWRYHPACGHHFRLYKEIMYREQINMLNVSSSNQELEKLSGYEYEVFLSFRGPDTRNDITNYLHTSMTEAGIRAYIDDEELRIGEEISCQLLQAIEQSKISIPIFSKGYVDSTWCLRELVKMVDSKNTRRHKIMLIFYNVAPSEVKYQTNHYGNAIVSHVNKKRFNDETINNWKAALNEVGALKGWDFQSMPHRGKGEIVKEIVNNVLTELKTAYLEVSDCLVEVDSHVDEIMRMICTHDHETKIIGIHGIGGMGKTTLAQIVYNQLSDDFCNCCFLSNVRETEITRLQNQLISSILKKRWPKIDNIMEGKKVIRERLCSKTMLLLLDDVDEASQLDALVQKREWFRKGSKIIITTRDRGILNVPTLVDWTYELIGMDFDHSLQLFSKHAFRRDYPIEQYIFHSERAVKICGGLPLALEMGGVHGIGSIEAICLKLDERSQCSLIKECLASLSNLRFLQVDSKEFDGITKSILNQLTNLSMRKLLILDLSMSRITEKWDGWSHIKRLILENCENLAQIHSSISQLKKLVFLNLKDCNNLRELPDEMGALESLRELLLDSTAIEEVLNGEG